MTSRFKKNKADINFKNSPEYPFGGTKDSGFGHECGEAGIKEWVTHKSLIIA